MMKYLNMMRTKMNREQLIKELNHLKGFESMADERHIETIIWLLEQKHEVPEGCKNNMYLVYIQDNKTFFEQIKLKIKRGII